MAEKSEKKRLFRAADARWRQVQKDWDRTRRRYSEDAVHDLRVACRRLIAVLEMLQGLVGDRRIEQTHRRVKRWLSALSPLRDVHIQQAYVAKMVRRYPSMRAFAAYLAAREDRTIRRVKRLLKKRPTLGGTLVKVARRARSEIRAKDIIRVVGKRYRDVLHCFERINPADTATIHRTRLAFKRFRYAAEVARPWVGRPLTDARMKQLHAYQTVMGEIQDAEVLLARLTKWIAKEGKTADEFQSALTRLEGRKQQSVERYMQSANRVRGFWTP
jgi:CHAD domain-containing protein